MKAFPFEKLMLVVFVLVVNWYRVQGEGLRGRDGVALRDGGRSAGVARCERVCGGCADAGEGVGEDDSEK